MIVRYGNYQHAINTTGLTISQEVLEDEAQVPRQIVTNLNLEGRLRNSLPSADPRGLDLKTVELVAYLSDDGAFLFRMSYSFSIAASIRITSCSDCSSLLRLFARIAAFDGCQVLSFRHGRVFRFRVLLCLSVVFFHPCPYCVHLLRDRRQSDFVYLWLD